MMVCRPTHHIFIWKYVSGIIPGNVMYTIHACIPGNATGSSIYIFFNHEVWLLKYVLSEPFTCKWSASKGGSMAAISVPLIFVLKDGNTCIEVWMLSIKKAYACCKY